MVLTKKRKQELKQLETVDTKYCLDCEEIKPLYKFPLNSKCGRKNTGSYCIKCDNRRTKIRQLERRNKITLLEYNKMLKKQNNKCAICGTKETGNKQNSRFCVDHDHFTGKIRGLLCHNCNRGLGAFRDNPEFLIAAAHYLNTK